MELLLAPSTQLVHVQTEDERMDLMVAQVCCLEIRHTNVSA